MRLRRAARSLRRLVRAAAQPAFIGAGYVAALSVLAERKPAEDEHELGAQAHAIEAFIRARYETDITRTAIGALAAAVLVGGVLGIFASALVALRERLHGRIRSRRPLAVLAVVAVMHAAFFVRAMAIAPQLYASAWYAQGGVRGAVQILATDVFHPSGIDALVLLGALAFLAGPRDRWRGWPWRVRRAALAARTPFGAVAGLAGIALFLGLALPDVVANASAHPKTAGATRPNVLILAADSLRADHLARTTAPHLSALAERGTRFDRAYVSLPRTFPSWITILTGRHPHHHGIRSMFPRWEERARDFDAVPERFARAGYATAVVSDYAGDIFSRVDLGFATVNVPRFDFRQLVRQRVLERQTPLLPFLHSRTGRAAFPVLREMNDAADPAMLAADVVRTMRDLEGHGPFFLLVFFSTAHFPYAAPAPFYGRLTDASYRGRFKYDKPVGLGAETPADASDQKQVRALYDGAVLAIDDAAQTVLDSLASDGIADRTIVVVTADHGETLYDHGHGQGHGDHLFGDEGTHVPLVVVDPRRTSAPRDVETIARDVDLAPTLYALAGVAPPADLDGRSLVPALDGKPLSPALAYAETGLWFTEAIEGLPADLRLPYPGIERLTEIDARHGDEIVLGRSVRPLTIVAKHRMVRDDRYKLIYAPARTGVRWLLFDTIADPGEEHDVARAHPDVVARLQGELWAWMRKDVAMTERGGYLVPLEASAEAREAAADASPGGGLRLDDTDTRSDGAEAGPDR